MKLSDKEIEARLSGLGGWAVEGNLLVRTYTFPGFPDAIAFVTRVAFDAEAADHHPDLTINYRRVRVVWSTHSAGGITEKDFAGAQQSDAVAMRLGNKT
jgi:4a-hydroxytetrahydrobiopterin dehydratase